MDQGTQNIEIHHATSDDTGLLSVLAAATFYEAYFEQDDPHDLSRYIIESFQTGRIEDEMADPNVTFLIAYQGGHAIGYAKLDAGTSHESITAERTIELKRIYILERVWGKGVGQILLKQCENVARESGYESIWLGVWQQNARGQSFYQKHGFVKRGTLEFPYGTSVGINDVMEKKLPRM